MKNTALRIEEQVSPANVGFLRLYEEMKMLFEEGTTLHYAREEGEEGVVGPYRRKAQLVAKLGNSGSPEKLHTVHNPENLTRQDEDFDSHNVWNGYVDFLEGKYQGTGIAFLNFFEGVDSGESEYASNQFKLLKMLIQRPHISGEPIYAMQILASCVIESNITNNEELGASVRAEAGGESGKVSFEFEGPKDFIHTVCKENQYDFESWLDMSKDTRETTQYVELPAKLSAAKVLEALMRLIGTELQGGEEDVTVSSVTVNSPDEGTKIETVIECEGTFGDLSILTDLGPDADEHGLRSCLKTLCESMNRMHPKPVENVNLNDLRDKEERHSHRFMIGENENKDCTWFYLAFGTRPEKQETDPSEPF